MTRNRWGGRDLLHRWEGNPILILEDMPFPCNTVFNGTPVKHDGEYLLLIRVEGQRGYSFFTLARSEDGYHFTVMKKPAMVPATNGPFAKYETRGIEDPRATFIDGTYYILYTAVSEHGYRIALAQTDDFEKFERIAMISEPGNKDGVLFPEKVGGYYVRLDRPLGLGVGSIWLSRSPDLINWGDSEMLLPPRAGYWDPFRVGASVPPIRTDKGWLEIYHGTKMTSAGPIYRAGAVMLDIEDPTIVLHRCMVPILSPREDYERIGDVGNVVFPCGAIVEPDGEIKVYYGAADTCMAVATANLSDLLECQTE
ncbi:MAG: glycoside hydrolase family 130 protein [Candidatus Marinimicrobia bacterium]|nr:glycoside hydrolase family 130 protein [Candidatus Neomarinimicrobiota bacterium]